MKRYERRTVTRGAGLFHIPLRQRYKNTPQVPQPANPTQVAQAQQGTNIGTAIANAGLQNVNQVTPYGSTQFNQSGGYTDPTTGQFVPSYTETTSLNPLSQALLTGTQQAGVNMLPIVNNLVGQAGGSTAVPLNFNTADSAILNSAPQAINDQVARAAYGTQAGFLDPQWNLERQKLEDQLSRGGIPVGSDAYNSAMTQFQNSKTQAYNAAQNNAIQTGAQVAPNLFNMALAGQQQNISQQQLAQQNPLRLLSMVYGGGGTGGAVA